MTEKIDVYYLTFDGCARDLRMQSRFQKLGLKAEKVHAKRGEHELTWGHLRMIKTFLDNSTKYFGIFLEDDVYFHKEFLSRIDGLSEQMIRLDIDILLMGYLMTHAPYGCHWLQQISEQGGTTFHSYPDDMWGGQCYMLIRPYAAYLIGKYNHQYLDNSLKYFLTPFKSDFVITKRGKRALIYPMLCVEEGEMEGDHPDQVAFHRNVTAFHYNPDLYY